MVWFGHIRCDWYRGEQGWPVEGVEGCCSRKEAVVEGLLGQGPAGRVGGTRHEVHWHARRQLRDCHVQLPGDCGRGAHGHLNAGRGHAHAD